MNNSRKSYIITDINLSWLLIIHVNSVLWLLHCVGVGDVVSDLEVLASSTLSVADTVMRSSLPCRMMIHYFYVYFFLVPCFLTAHQR